MAEYETNPFRHELNPSERIIWQGQPKQGILFRPYDIITITSGFMMCLMVAVFAYTIVHENEYILGMIMGLLFLIPFIFFAIYSMFLRYFVDLGLRKKTHYAVTNQRAIIISGLFNKNIKSIDLAKISEINLSMKNDTRGTITFGSPNSMTWVFAGSGLPENMYRKAPSFEQIDDAKAVYQHIKRVQRELSGQ